MSLCRSDKFSIVRSLLVLAIAVLLRQQPLISSGDPQDATIIDPFASSSYMEQWDLAVNFGFPPNISVGYYDTEGDLLDYYDNCQCIQVGGHYINADKDEINVNGPMQNEVNGQMQTGYYVWWDFLGPNWQLVNCTPTTCCPADGQDAQSLQTFPDAEGWGSTEPVWVNQG